MYVTSGSAATRRSASADLPEPAPPSTSTRPGSGGAAGTGPGSGGAAGGGTGGGTVSVSPSRGSTARQIWQRRGEFACVEGPVVRGHRRHQRPRMHRPAGAQPAELGRMPEQVEQGGVIAGARRHRGSRAVRDGPGRRQQPRPVRRGHVPPAAQPPDPVAGQFPLGAVVPLRRGRTGPGHPRALQPEDAVDAQPGRGAGDLLPPGAPAGRAAAAGLGPAARAAAAQHADLHPLSFARATFAEWQMSRRLRVSMELPAHPAGPPPGPSACPLQTRRRPSCLSKILPGMRPIC